MNIISRSVARSLGVPRYQTGKQCKQGHISERYTSTGNCLACLAAGARASTQQRRDYQERYRAENGDKVRAAQARHRAVHPGRVSARAEAFAAAHPDRVSEYGRRYRASANGLASGRKRASVRRARARAALPLWWGEFDELVASEAASLAQMREAATGFAWHVDHMVPLAARDACGLHCAANLQVIPGLANRRKQNKMQLTKPGEWIAIV